MPQVENFFWESKTDNAKQCADVLKFMKGVSRTCGRCIHPLVSLISCMATYGDINTQTKDQIESVMAVIGFVTPRPGDYTSFNSLIENSIWKYTCEKWQINIQPKSGAPFTVDVDPSDTIADIKNEIYYKQCIPLEAQRQIISTRSGPLSDNDILEDIRPRIKEDSTLILDTRFRLGVDTEKVGCMHCIACPP